MAFKVSQGGSWPDGGEGKGRLRTADLIPMVLCALGWHFLPNS